MKLAILAAIFSVATASGVSISGRIVDDATGAAVPKSEVRIFGPMLSPLLIEADDDGSFQTANLAAGDYTMTAWHAGYLFTEVISGYPPVIRLVKLGVIEGQLTGLAGRPARIMAMVKSGDAWKPVLDILARGVPAGPDGSFRIPDLPPGQYALLVSYGQSGVLQFDLAGKMRAQIPIPPNGNRLVEGHVEFPDPRNRYWVTLSDPANPELALATVVTDETGSFSFPGVVPGAYELLAVSRRRGGLPGEGFARVPIDVTQDDSRVIGITMEPGKSVSIAWHEACGIAGITLLPLEDWGVWMEREQFRSGIASINDPIPMLLVSPQRIDGLAPARYAVGAGSGECQVAGNPVIDLTKPQTGDFELTLTAREVVSGIPNDFTMGEPSLHMMWFSEPAPGLRSFRRKFWGWDQASPWPPHVRMAVPPGR